MLTALWIVVIIEEVDGKLRCVLIHFFGQGTDILAYSPTIFHRTLAADFIKDSHTLFVSLRVAYTLTAGAAHVVHTDGGKCLDAMVYLRSTDRVAASATDADYSYLISIDSRMVREEIDCRTEVFYPHFGRFHTTRITATLAIIGRIEG